MTQSMIIMRLCKYVQAMQNEPVYNNIIIYNIYNIITDIKSDLRPSPPQTTYSNTKKGAIDPHYNYNHRQAII